MDASVLDPHTQADNDASRSTVEDHRKSLPIYAFRETLLDAIKEFPALIVIGEPGTGVSTQLPQYLLESGFGEKLKIGITQPADSGNPIESIAAYVANEIGCELGTVVGVKERTSQETKIHYTTDDALEAEFHQDMDAMEYCALILDESSERIVESDEIFRLSRGVLERRPDFRIIVALSSYIDVERYSEYFSEAPEFFIPGRTYLPIAQVVTSSVEVCEIEPEPPSTQYE